ncbi:hypothetical protein CDD82_6887 [Ophiocordyceps australis]|uniref:Uncharacterized protein n=1 Tax=Ophiocordyceps australis TaxID=1399860 RepID=A0A2C5Y2K8_9HYPO|nr:hypothetical protein CDD82_6887 [Ophiocordyceps australis]
MVPDDHSTGEAMADDDTPDNLTIASAPNAEQDDRMDVCSTGHRKRKRDEELQMTEQQHSLYGDDLLDYFLLSQNEQCAVRPDPPPNFIPNYTIDSDDHTALHWASSMGDIDVIRQLKRLNASATVRNVRGETPLMRAVNFTNCFEKQTFPIVFKEFFDTYECRDNTGQTVLHHAALMRSGRLDGPASSEYYLDIILNNLQEALEPSVLQQFLDSQDNNGNTALHVAAEGAAQANVRKCLRALLGRNASTHIANNEGVCVEEVIRDINLSKTREGPTQHRSSSPFAPDPQRQASFRHALTNCTTAADALHPKPASVCRSAAAATIHSRVAPLILEKFNELAKIYDEEWQEKESAEMEARRLLANTQAELANSRRHVTNIEAQLEPDEVATKTLNEANLAKHQVLSLIEYQNKQLIHQAVDDQLAQLADADGGRNNNDSEQQSDSGIGYEDHLALARELQRVLGEQRQEEMDYVEALSLVGVGDRIDRYRHLLRHCLDTKDSESLDGNLDTMIEMMEEECDVDEGDIVFKPTTEPLD